jgi:CRISPR-associated protein Csm3
MKKVHQYTVRGIITLKSNMRTGGDDAALQIGGADLICLKDPLSGRPYIPGSSIKGKMRSSLEKLTGNFSGPDRNLPSTDGIIARIFGPHGNDKKYGPTRVRVHDAQVLGDFTFGSKGSTAIDRQSGTALRGSLRTDEFVTPGAQFSFRIDVDEYDIDQDVEYENADGVKVKGINAMIALIDHGIDELVNTGIGAGIGKGYGQIEIGETVVERVKRRGRLSFPPETAAGTTRETAGEATKDTTGGA